MKHLVFIFLILPYCSFTQATKKDSLWLLLKPFTGAWTGEGEGEPGKGKYERSYHFILNKNFIEIRNKSIYPPSTNHPNGEVHEDIGYFSYDKSKKKFQLRQFHVESFVITYELDSVTADQKPLYLFRGKLKTFREGIGPKKRTG